MDSTLLNILLQKSKDIMSEDKMYHDFPHAKNVFENAKQLINTYGGDEVVILTAALFHDIARDVDNHEEVGALKLREILNNIPEFPKDKIEETCTAVLHHEQGHTTENEKILSDADKIDAFNILGIGRGFMMSASKGCILKEAIDRYLELLDKWYKGFYFEKSRTMAKEGYDEIGEILNRMKDMYK